MEKEVVIFETLPTKVNNAWILDGMAQIQMVMKGDAFIFGELADIHFNIIQSLFRIEETVRIDIVFDRYNVTDSIQSIERSRWVTNYMGMEVKMHNPSTQLPRQWGKYICDPKYKTALITFISNYSADKARSSLQTGNILVIGGGLKKVTKLPVFEVGTHPWFKGVHAIMKKQTHVCYFMLLMQLICYQGLWSCLLTQMLVCILFRK